MRGFSAVFRRELLQRRFVFAAAILASLVPFLVPITRGLAGQHASDSRAITAAVLAVVFLYGLSAFLAGTVIPSGIAQRRIGFDFARPLSSVAIWGGTLLAISVLAVGAAVVVAAPTAMADRAAFREACQTFGAGTPARLALLVAGFLLFAGLVQAFSVAVRSRSLLLVLDLVALLATLATTGAFLQTLLFADAPRLVEIAIRVIVVAGAIGVLAGTFAAVASGRTEIRRAHRAQSIVLWTGMAVGLGLVGGWIAWMRSATPTSLDEAGWVKASTNGDWVAVDGRARGLPAAYLTNLVTGRYRRLHLLPSPVVFSGNGHRAVWLALADGKPHLVTATLGDAASESRSLPLPWPESPRLILMDAAGSRVALLNGSEIAVLNLRDGSVLARAPLATGGDYPRGYFLGEGLVRIVHVSRPSDSASRFDIYELQVAAGRIVLTGSIENVASWPFSVSVDPGGSRLLFKTGEALRLADARSGSPIAEIASGPADSRRARFLPDGRILVAEQSGGTGSLRAFSADGQPLWSSPLPSGRRSGLGGEIGPGEFIVGVGEIRDQTIFVADTRTGAIRRLAEHVSPVLEFSNFFDALNFSPAPGSLATRLFYAQNDTLVRLDPATGARTVLLGKGAR